MATERDRETSRTPGRNRKLRKAEHLLEGPMVFLAFVWVGLMVIEFAGARHAWLDLLSNAIWAAFVMDFVLRLALAERKVLFMRRNWLTLISLALPALRIFRLTKVLRLSRATRGLRLVRLGTSLNRSVRALMRSMGKKGGGYVFALTGIVTVAGAAGMYALEGSLFISYWDALWWTAMVITTMGSELWPHSLEGRILCLFLAVYAFSVFGYVTAALASFLLERNRPADEPDQQRLVSELAQLRQEMARLSEAISRNP